MAGVLRSAAGATLATSARILSFGAKALSTAARMLSERDEQPSQGRPPTAVAEDLSAETTGAEAVPRAQRTPAAERRSRVQQPAPPPTTVGERPFERRSESYIAELAAKPVGEVVSAIQDLSTDELRSLTEYETSHRNRKGVLQAIEAALTPGRQIVLPDSGRVPTDGS